MARSPNHRLAAGVGLLAGFYAVALSAALALLAGAVAVVLLGVPGRFWIAAACVVAAVVLARSFVPRRAAFMPPGPRLDPARHPELAAVIRELAAATRLDPPAETYLACDASATVREVGGVLLLPGCRVLTLGLPLLDTLTVEEVRALLAGEFARHGGGRERRLARFFVRAYDGIALTVAQGEGTSPWGRVLGVYGRFFLRRAAHLRRDVELSADAAAAQMAGRDSTAAALRGSVAARATLEGFLADAFVPAVDGGVLPPFREGFERYRGVPDVRDAVARRVEAESARTTAPHDARPSLGERLAALGAPGDARHPGRGRPAVELIHELDRLEDELIRNVLADRELLVRRAGWDEVPDSVLVPAWRVAATERRALLAGVTAGALPQALDRDPAAAETLASGLALALYDAGWTLSAPIGEPVRLTRGRKAVEPFELTARLASGGIDAAAWSAHVKEARIATLPLGGGATGEPRHAALAR